MDEGIPILLGILFIILTALSLAAPVATSLLVNTGNNPPDHIVVSIGFTPLHLYASNSYMVVTTNDTIYFYRFNSTRYRYEEIKEYRYDYEIIDLKSNDELTVVATTNGVYVYKTTDGTLLHSMPIDASEKASILLNGDRYYMAIYTRSGSLIYIDSGGRTLTITTGYPLKLSVLRDNEYIYVAVSNTSSLTIYRVNGNNLEPWRKFSPRDTIRNLYTFHAINPSEYVVVYESAEGAIGIARIASRGGGMELIGSTSIGALVTTMFHFHGIVTAQGSRYLVISTRRDLGLYAIDNNIISSYRLLRARNSFPVYAGVHNNLIYTVYPYGIYIIGFSTQAMCRPTSFILWHAPAPEGQRFTSAYMNTEEGVLAIGMYGKVIIYWVERLKLKPLPTISIADVFSVREGEDPIPPACRGGELVIFNTTAIRLSMDQSRAFSGGQAIALWRITYINPETGAREGYEEQQNSIVIKYPDITKPVTVNISLIVTDPGYNLSNDVNMTVIILPFYSLDTAVEKMAEAIADFIKKEIEGYRDLLTKTMIKIEYHVDTLTLKIAEIAEKMVKVIYSIYFEALKYYLIANITLHDIFNNDKDRDVYIQIVIQIVDEIKKDIMKNIDDAKTRLTNELEQIINSNRNTVTTTINILSLVNMRFLETIGYILAITPGLNVIKTRIDEELHKRGINADTVELFNYITEVGDTLHEIGNALSDVASNEENKPLPFKKTANIIIEYILKKLPEGSKLSRILKKILSGFEYIGYMLKYITIVLKTLSIVELFISLVGRDTNNKFNIEFYETYVNITIYDYIRNITQKSDFYRHIIFNSTNRYTDSEYVLINKIPYRLSQLRYSEYNYIYVNITAIKSYIIKRIHINDIVYRAKIAFLIQQRVLNAIEIAHYMYLGFAPSFYKIPVEHAYKAADHLYSFVLKTGMADKIIDLAISVAGIQVSGPAAIIVGLTSVAFLTYSFISGDNDRRSAIRKMIMSDIESFADTTLISRLNYMEENINCFLRYMDTKQDFDKLEQYISYVRGISSLELSLSNRNNEYIQKLSALNATIFSYSMSLTPIYSRIAARIVYEKAYNVINIGFSVPARYWYEGIPRTGTFIGIIYSIVTGPVPVLINVEADGVYVSISVEKLGFWDTVKLSLFSIAEEIIDNLFRLIQGSIPVITIPKLISASLLINNPLVYIITNTIRKIINGFYKVTVHIDELDIEGDIIVNGIWYRVFQQGFLGSLFNPIDKCVMYGFTRLYLFTDTGEYEKIVPGDDIFTDSAYKAFAVSLVIPAPHNPYAPSGLAYINLGFAEIGG